MDIISLSEDMCKELISKQEKKNSIFRVLMKIGMNQAITIMELINMKSMKAIIFIIKEVNLMKE